MQSQSLPVPDPWQALPPRGSSLLCISLQTVKLCLSISLFLPHTPRQKHFCAWLEICFWHFRAFIRNTVLFFKWFYFFYCGVRRKQGPHKELRRQHPHTTRALLPALATATTHPAALLHQPHTCSSASKNIPKDWQRKICLQTFILTYHSGKQNNSETEEDLLRSDVED